MLSPRVGLVVAMVLPSLAWAEEKPRPPTSLPPQTCLATAAEKDGAIQIRASVPRMIPYTVTRNVPYTVTVLSQEGKPEQITRFKPVTETCYKAVMSEIVLVADGKEVRVCRKDGKEVAPQDLPKLLGKQTPVLIFTQGEIDPYYLQVVQDQVLILVIPASTEFPWRPKAEQ